MQVHIHEKKISSGTRRAKQSLDSNVSSLLALITGNTHNNSSTPCTYTLYACIYTCVYNRKIYLPTWQTSMCTCESLWCDLLTHLNTYHSHTWKCVVRTRGMQNMSQTYTSILWPYILQVPFKFHVRSIAPIFGKF